MKRYFPIWELFDTEYLGFIFSDFKQNIYNLTSKRKQLWLSKIFQFTIGAGSCSPLVYSSRTTERNQQLFWQWEGEHNSNLWCRYSSNSSKGKTYPTAFSELQGWFFIKGATYWLSNFVYLWGSLTQCSLVVWQLHHKW